MMGFIDGELDADQQRTFQDHARQCPQCSAELVSYQKLAELTNGLKLKEPADYEWERIYKSIFYKIENRAGWLFVVAGCAMVFGYLLYEICAGWEISTGLRVGIVTALAGFLLLLVSAVRSRLRIKKYDRYEAVKR
jgi:hypothetical protein